MCTAVGTGFVIMGAVGYIVKLSTSSFCATCVSRLTWQ